MLLNEAEASFVVFLKQDLLKFNKNFHETILGDVIKRG